MRFLENSPTLPDELLHAQDEGRVVFFCGAGVSMGAGLPSFSGLADNVLQILGANGENVAKRLYDLSAELEQKHNLKGVLSADQVFGRLARDYAPKDINCAVAESLKPNQQANLSAHKTILKLATLRGGHTRLITTNFDLLFEQASKKKIPSRTRSNLPRIEYADNDWGIIHLHGMVCTDYSEPTSDGFVLSSGEFGEAYLAHGWARTFVRDILDRYIAVFIGYSADDPPVRYLLEGLQHGKEFRHKLYAFQSAGNDEAIAQWEEKGVQPIIYDSRNKHASLWDTLHLWAERSKDPAAWKKRLLRKANKGPTKMPPHERGMLAHLVSSIDGAKAFSEQKPPMPSEWLCVFDPEVRCKTSDRDRYKLYGLDDDPVPPEQNAPKSEDDLFPAEQKIEIAKPRSRPWSALALNKEDCSRPEIRHMSSLIGFNANAPYTLVPRLNYIAHWLGTVSHERITLWWLGQQKGMHPALNQNITFTPIRNKAIKNSEIVRRAFTTILELMNSQSPSDEDEHLFRMRVKEFGWDNACIREYLNAATPHLVCGTLYHSVPRDNRKKLDPHSLVKVEVNYPESLYDVDVPKEHLPKIVSGLRFCVERAVDMETDYSLYWRDICPIEPDEKSEEESYTRRYGLSGYVLHFIKLYKKLIELDIRKARQEFRAWRSDPVFTKLRIWACGQKDITDETEFVEEMLSLTVDDFWHSFGDRDLLYCLRANWHRLSPKNRILIEKKIKKGPSKLKKSTAIENENRSAFLVLNRFHWLADQNCSLSFDLNKLTEELSKKAPDWKPDFAKRAADSLEGRSGWVKTDTNYAPLEGVPLSQIIQQARNKSGRDHIDFVEYSPFSGLCDEKPLWAISALALENKNNRSSPDYWEIFLSREGKRKDDRPRLKKLLCGRIIQLPDDQFKEILLTASRWFQSVGPTLRNETPTLFVQLWDKFLRVIALHESNSGSSIIRSENESIDWAAEAINSASGNLAELHMTDPLKNDLKSGQQYPQEWIDRTNSLLSLPGNSHRYALVIFSFNLSWFYTIDPDWTSTHILEILENQTFDAQDQDAVWAGFMWGAKMPPLPLFVRLKIPLLKLAQETPLIRRQHSEVLSALLLIGWGTKNNKSNRYVSDHELREVLLKSGEDFRNQTLWHLEKWSRESSGKWRKQVEAFLNNVWPKNNSVRTARISARLCDLALAQESNFPKISGIISRLASKTNDEYFDLPEIRKSGSNLATKYPDVLLELLFIVLPENPARWPFGCRETLKLIEQSKPKLLNDPRLIELKTRINDI